MNDSPLSIIVTHNNSLSLSILMAIFQLNVFLEAKDDGGGGDNWTSCAKLQSNHHHQQTNNTIFYMPDVLPVAQPSVKTLKGKYHIRWTCLSQAYLGSSNFVSDH